LVVGVDDELTRGRGIKIPSKRKKGATPKKAGNTPKACTKCATGETNHSSGIYRMCKNKTIDAARARGGPPP
jgi:hypothetical protein